MWFWRIQTPKWGASVFHQQLIAAYRNVGSRWADLDPLKRKERDHIPELELSSTV